MRRDVSARTPEMIVMLIPERETSVVWYIYIRLRAVPVAYTNPQNEKEKKRKDAPLVSIVTLTPGGAFPRTKSFSSFDLNSENTRSDQPTVLRTSFFLGFGQLTSGAR